jgi:polyisoprenyl-phosphate glycosyltransferase
MVNSLVVPIYNNEGSIEALVAAVEQVAVRSQGSLEAIFVVDGGQDESHRLLLEALERRGASARVAEHSRNFGAFAAVRTGMSLATGRYVAVMSADLQEPPDLIVEFFERLAGGGVDIVAGERRSRDDRGDGAARIYWRLYRRFVLGEIPPGGVDVFACTRAVRDVVCSLEDVHTSLVAQLFWVGFKRELIPYDRIPRPRKSGWTFRRKFRYLADSVFAFTDLPVRALWTVGVLGIAISVIAGSIVLVARLLGAITVPGYAGIALTLLFFLGLNSLGLGIIGSYVWRAYEGVKRRPGAIVREVVEIGEGAHAPAPAHAPDRIHA